jgi:hypothetical protein
MRIFISVALLLITTLSVRGAAAASQELEILKHDYYLLEHYRLTYSPDIFDYCVKKHGSVARFASSCMEKQDRHKKRALKKALEQLGRHSLAQAVYDDCLDYYPYNSALRVSKCVYTRLNLNLMLEDETVEKTIYHLCDVKWRKRGYRSVDNCSTSDARYFQRTGDYRD